MKQGDEPAHAYHKQSVYFPAAMLDEIRAEARRLNRSASWVVQRAWRLSRLEIQKLEPREP